MLHRRLTRSIQVHANLHQQRAADLFAAAARVVVVIIIVIGCIAKTETDAIHSSGIAAVIQRVQKLALHVVRPEIRAVVDHPTPSIAGVREPVDFSVQNHDRGAILLRTLLAAVRHAQASVHVGQIRSGSSRYSFARLNNICTWCCRRCCYPFHQGRRGCLFRKYGFTFFRVLPNKRQQTPRAVDGRGRSAPFDGS